MSGGFNNPIIGGGGTLVYPAIKSPNFSLANKTGWAIMSNGNAYFFNITAEGSVIAGTYSGTDFILNSNGLFFYGASTPALVQASQASNGNFTAASSPATILSSAWTATVAGNTGLFVVQSYATGYLSSSGALSASFNNSGAALTHILGIQFQNGNAPPGANAYGWLDVFLATNMPGGDTGIEWTRGLNTAEQVAFTRTFYEFNGLGASPTVDVLV